MYESLRREMQKQNIKTYTLAKRSDIVPSDLYQALKGQRPMYPNWRRRIAEALNAPVDELFPNDVESEAN